MVLNELEKGQRHHSLITSEEQRKRYSGTPDLPEDLRMQKLIMVFPDGCCRDPDGTPDYLRECIRGTFYADSVRPDGPQMQTILFELMDYIDAMYRTKLPEDLPETY